MQVSKLHGADRSMLDKDESGLARTNIIGFIPMTPRGSARRCKLTQGANRNATRLRVQGTSLMLIRVKNRLREALTRMGLIAGGAEGVILFWSADNSVCALSHLEFF